MTPTPSVGHLPKNEARSNATIACPLHVIRERDVSTVRRIVGRGPAMTEVLRELQLVARTESTVLIQGETGTGKELIANAIHHESRRTGPFVSVNVAAIPTSLWESEMFGHERGAFTGATSARVGHLEQAGDGTLFLDEVGELESSLQPKLLRLLQEREFRRVGSGATRSFSARVIAATNRDLHEMVEAGTFRADLYYRLNVFRILVPPLRERAEDILEVAAHFVEAIARRMGRSIPRLPPETARALEGHEWPGNVRELHNVIESALIRCPGDELRVALEPKSVPPSSRPLDALDRVNRAHILRVLEQSNWVISGPNGAAARLGLKRTTLNHRLRKLGIHRVSPRSEAP